MMCLLSFAMMAKSLMHISFVISMHGYSSEAVYPALADQSIIQLVGGVISTSDPVMSSHMITC